MLRKSIFPAILICLCCFSCKNNPTPQPKQYKRTATANDMLKHAQAYRAANDSTAAAATYPIKGSYKIFQHRKKPPLPQHN